MPSSKYILPFGGTTTSRERLQERRQMKRMDKKQLCSKVLNGEEPSGIYDSGASSTFVAKKDKKHFKSTEEPSGKVVGMPNGMVESAGEKLEMHNELRAPANTADEIPSIRQTLISGSKVADAGYVTVFDEEEVNVYEAEDVTIKSTAQSVLTGFRDKLTRLWRVPLAAKVSNKNTDTMLLGETQSKQIMDEIAANVHDLPSTERVIRYLHAACGFPTKPTWLQAIQSNFYPTWPMLNAKNVNKYFPESEETQKGHMRQIRTGTRKTNRKVRFIMTGTESELQDIDICNFKNSDENAMIFSSKYTSAQTQHTLIKLGSSQFGPVKVMCEIDGNQILAEPMTSRRTASLIKAYAALLQRLNDQGSRSASEETIS